jgi:hypothetical protein
MRKQYCIYTRDYENALGIIRALHDMGAQYEPHINRTRFWLDTQVPSHQRFYLRYGTLIHCVDHETDHATGT